MVLSAAVLSPPILASKSWKENQLHMRILSSSLMCRTIIDQQNCFPVSSNHRTVKPVKILIEQVSRHPRFFFSSILNAQSIWLIINPFKTSGLVKPSNNATLNFMTTVYIRTHDRCQSSFILFAPCRNIFICSVESRVRCISSAYLGIDTSSQFSSIL